MGIKKLKVMGAAGLCDGALAVEKPISTIIHLFLLD